MGKDKYEFYFHVKPCLQNAGYEVGEYKDINYGIQFITSREGANSIIRVFQGKKGLTVDLSQVRRPEEAERLNSLLDISNTSPGEVDDEIGEGLIGVDESGKGDYFGPLVVAGVYVNAQTAPVLRRLKVDDSKKLTDAKISSIAPEIKKLCSYEVITISNRKYNELYERFANLNKLLAWGHARVIENLLAKVDCRRALSDQFGNPALIKNALMERGRSITLEQRPRAEENVAVAAASILARDEFVTSIEQLKERFDIDFPKGASGAIARIGRKFIMQHGEACLGEVAKLHFKTTAEILSSSQNEI